VFTIASFLVLKPFLDILFSPEVLAQANTSEGFIASWQAYFNQTLSGYILAYGKKAGLLLVASIVVFTFLFKNLFRYLSLYVMAPVRFGIERRIRDRVFNKLLFLPFGWFSEERKGDLMSRITVDVHEIQWSIIQSIETVVRSPIMIIGSLAVMLYISPLLTIFSFVLILFVGVIIGGVAKTLKKSSTKAQESQGRLLSILDETLGGLRIVRSFNAEDYQQQNFTNESQYYAKTMQQIMQRKDLSSPLTEFLGIAVIMVLLVFGGRMVFDGYFTASTFVVFITMFYNIIDPAKSFSSAYYAIQKGSAAIERIDQITDAPSEDSVPDGKDIQNLHQGITFQKVAFAYEQEQKVLQDISFNIPKGTSVALVGESGAGKSTLVDLLLRFYETTEGDILIDNHSIKDYRLQSLRQLMSLVSQEAILFNDTIYNNIVFGLEDITEAAVIQAAKAANAHAFIQATENGYQTNIGDRGTKLSGGQRQRITIARAILRNPPILILDEATSALDSASEKLVQEALLRVMKQRTSIIIAHRLSTIQHCDNIIVMKDGQIIEQGTHQQLLQANKIYNKLVKLQQM